MNNKGQAGKQRKTVSRGDQTGGARQVEFQEGKSKQ